MPRRIGHSDLDDSTKESRAPKLQDAFEFRKDLAVDASTVQRRWSTLMESTPVELAAPCIIR